MGGLTWSGVELEFLCISVVAGSISGSDLDIIKLAYYFYTPATVTYLLNMPFFEEMI